ncbi:MAG: alpha/beta fold hydrolase [Steroidobacteraceae bacterium]
MSSAGPDAGWAALQQALWLQAAGLVGAWPLLCPPAAGAEDGSGARHLQALAWLQAAMSRSMATLGPMPAASDLPAYREWIERADLAWVEIARSPECLAALRVLTEAALDACERTGLSLPGAASGAARGCTTGQVVGRPGGHRLHHYAPHAPARGLPPVLVSYALVNRPWVVDLEPGRSLLQQLLEQGLEVYLLEWTDPLPADRQRDLEHYLDAGIRASVAAVTERSGRKPCLLGICQGGTLALCHAALFPETIDSLVTMVTPVDFSTPDNLLGHWSRALDEERIVQVLGNVPGAWLNLAFLALRPWRLLTQKYVEFGTRASDPQAVETFLRMERWIFDSPDQAGAAFAQFCRVFYRENRLVTGGLAFSAGTVDLSRIRCPVLNIFGSEDHLVPPAASRPLGSLLVAATYEELEVPTGHIGMYVSRAAREVPEKIAAWLATGR